jgi:Bacterial regulatory proteins, gntR family
MSHDECRREHCCTFSRAVQEPATRRTERATVDGMASLRRRELVATLRQRLLRALQIRAIAPGDRLPGTRELAREFAADPRVVADAYRELAAEGLVELRPRAGAFLHPALGAPPARARTSLPWLADVFAAGIARGIAAPDLPRLLRRALGKPPVPVVVLATTIDQTMGICLELEELLGVASSSVLIESLPPDRPASTPAEARAALPRAVQRARLLVTTEAHADRVTALAHRLNRPSVGVTVRRELYETEWALLHAEEVYVLVVDPRFGSIVEHYLRKERRKGRVHVLVVGRDDLAAIPEEAPVYVTHAARSRIGALHLPRGLLPPARILSDDCVGVILGHVLEIQRNDAMHPGVRAR